jgi:hypothetical protein
MSADESNAPVVADRETGVVSADLSDVEDDTPIVGPARWVASLLWVILVVALALVMVGSAAAMILNYIAPNDPPQGAETMLALFMGSQSGLIGLFVSRPGGR